MVSVSIPSTLQVMAEVAEAAEAKAFWPEDGSQSCSPSNPHTIHPNCKTAPASHQWAKNISYEEEGYFSIAGDKLKSEW